MTGERPARLRLRQGLVLLAGALVFAVLVGSGPDTFHWTPLGVGLVYLAAAGAGGRRGSYWSGAFVLCGWGAAVVLAREGQPDLDIAGLYLLGAGTGAAAAIALRRWGLEADPLGAALTVAAAGAILAFEGEWAALTEARTYALLVGAVAVVAIARGLLAERASTSLPASK